MSHHSSFDNPEHNRAMHEAMRKVLGEYPNGKLNVQDEGALAYSVGIENKAVVIKFPKPVAWVGFRPQDAAELASALIKWARKLGIQTGQTVTIEIGP